MYVLSCLTLCYFIDCNCKAPLSMGFPRQEYWSGLPFPSPGDLPNPGIETPSLASPAFAGRFFTTSATWEAHAAGTESNVEVLASGHWNGEQGLTHSFNKVEGVFCSKNLD